jgi:hypothetical protein
MITGAICLGPGSAAADPSVQLPPSGGASLDQRCGGSNAPHFESLDGKQTLCVNGSPYVVLGVYDLTGLNTALADPSLVARYYDLAELLGFNTISLSFQWQDFERTENVNDPVGTFRTDLLEQHRLLAKAHGMKLIIRWLGSNIGGRRNFAPDYLRPEPHDSSTAPFPYVGYEEQCTTSEPWTREIFDYCDSNASDPDDLDTILGRERRAIRQITSWLADPSNDPDHTYIMIQLNNEVKVAQCVGGDPTYHLLHNRDECASLVDDLVAEGVLYSEDILSDGNPCRPEAQGSSYEACNQAIFRAYYQQLAETVHELAGLETFPAFMNVYAPQNTDEDMPGGAGAPDPYYEQYSVSVPPTAELDPFLGQWLDQCPDLAFIGPDWYHIGWPGPRDLDGKSWWQGMLFPAWYHGGRNVPLRTESGTIVSHNEKPYRDIFPLLGDRYSSLVGDVVFQLAGSATEDSFQGLVESNDPGEFRFRFDADLLHDSYYKAFYLENSFRALREAAPLVARLQRTDYLVAFAAGDEGTDQAVVTGAYPVGGTLVNVVDRQSWRNDPGSSGGAHRGKARGLIMKKAERDFTLVGVDVTVEIPGFAKASKLHPIRCERGSWGAQLQWYSRGLVPCLAKADGSVTVTLSADDVPTSTEETSMEQPLALPFPDAAQHLSLVKTWFASHRAAKRYLVRVYQP